MEPALPAYISPLPQEQWPPELIEDWPTPGGPPPGNVIGTLAHHPRLANTAWNLLTVLMSDELSERHREMIILRSACLNRSTYEWSFHHPIAKSIGLNDTDLEQIGKGPNARGWSDPDRTVLAAVDDLHHFSQISDATGAQLAQIYRPRQVLQLIFLTGIYRTTITMLNSCHTPLGKELHELPLPGPS